MWFMLNTTFTNHLGSMDDLANTYTVNYKLSGYSKNGSNTIASIDKEVTSFKTYLILDSTKYEYNENGISVTGGTLSSKSFDSSTNILTLSITGVSGSVTITAAATSTSSGGSEGDSSGGDDSGGSGTTWYIDHREQVNSFDTSVNIAGRGWCHVPGTPAYEAYVGKPVNTLGFFTTATSQSVVISKVAEQGGESDMTVIATVTATGSGTKEFVSVTFPTVTLADGECLCAFTQDDSNINFYFTMSSVTDANGVSDYNFYGRVPKVYGSGSAWTSQNDSICLGWSIGYTN